MTARRILILLTIFLVAAGGYRLSAMVGGAWKELTSPPLRAVDYNGKFRIGVAPDLIGNEKYFPCLSQPIKFRVKGGINSELLPPRIERLEPLNFPEDMWQNEEFARIKQFIEMWEAVEPEVDLQSCENGLWCVPQNLQPSHYLVYTGRSLRAARDGVKGASAFGFQICP